MIDQVLIGFAFFVTAIVFHELGHFIVAYRYGRKPYIIFTGKKLYTEFSSDTPSYELKRILSFGVVLGFLPLFIGLYIAPLGFMFIPLYIMGIVSDIKQMRTSDDTRTND